jgi:hypothetical protein
MIGPSNKGKPSRHARDEKVVQAVYARRRGINPWVNTLYLIGFNSNETSYSMVCNEFSLGSIDIYDSNFISWNGAAYLSYSALYLKGKVRSAIAGITVVPLAHRYPFSPNPGRHMERHIEVHIL